MTEIPLTVSEAAAKLRSGELTSVALTEAVLRRADELDPRLGTFVARFEEPARKSAQHADDCFSAGIEVGPLQGIPVAVKDIIAVSEGPTTANSLVLDRDWGSNKDAPVVTRLKMAKAVIVGKTTTSEYACGSPDPTKPFAVPRNPWDTERSPAGSSAGTGNGVAVGMFLAGLGTDTGGSIRAPASFNGITGLKPTFGLVPKSGCVPLGYSLDHIGPMARSARDCAAMLGVIAGYHPSDECSVNRPVEDFLAQLETPLDGLRVGVEHEHHFPSGSSDDLRQAFDGAVDALSSLGATTVEVSLPNFHEMLAATMVTMLPEGLAYHGADLEERWGDYYASTRLNLAMGALVSSRDYVQAQRARRATQRKLAELFGTVDVIVSPTSPTAAPLIAESDGFLVPRLLRSSFTSYWNAVGQPALAMPMGFDSNDLPLSFQVAGRPFEDALVLRVGHALQTVTDWHLRVPPLAQALTAWSSPR